MQTKSARESGNSGNHTAIMLLVTLILLLLLTACQSAITTIPVKGTAAASQEESGRTFPSAESTPLPTSAPQASPTIQAPVLPFSPVILYVASEACVVKAVSINGGEPITLTTNPPPYDCWRPKFSPDGKKLAFVLTDGNYDLYVMNLDGSGLTKVADAIAFAWSPDSTQLAYQNHNRETQQGGLAVVNVDGSGAHAIGYPDISICTSCDGDIDLSWSPDGEWLYAPADIDFPKSNLTTANIFKVDGSKHYQMSTAEVSIFTAAAWSPDSQRLALPSPGVDGNGCGGLQIMSPTGGAQTIQAGMAHKMGEPGISPSCFSISSVAWSPDGRSILSVGYPQGKFAPGEVQYERILLVSPGNQSVSILEYWPGHPGAFLWSPDGSQFVFTSSPNVDASETADGPLVLMRNSPEFAEYNILAEKAKNSPGALFWSGQ